MHGGSTNKRLAVLRDQGIHGSFYVLGERLQQRAQAQPSEALADTYAEQCVALHGWTHVSHQHAANWQQSAILFHDTHAKAETAVPWLLAQTRAAGVTWTDCRGY